MRRRVSAQHADWLSLVDSNGAFLTLPVLKRVFPNGLDVTDATARAEVRGTLEQLGTTEADRTAWLRFLLRDVLEWGGQLVEGAAIPAALQHIVAEHGVTLRPELALLDTAPGAPRARLLVCRWPLHTPLDRRVAGDRWAATPIERAITLCRETNVPLALVTDTESFTLVHAPRNGAAGWGTWHSELFGEERSLLDAFVSLLGVRRFFAAGPNDTLEKLFEESASAQAEVTNQLGLQVRQAVELLVSAISRVDRERRGELLAGVKPEEVYNAAVTVMMRLVFLLSAEERRLFPADDEFYLESYAISSLREQLEVEARDGEEALERRSTAWHRVLATFRAIYGGIQHERLRLPAYGGGLFDPDRYPFLEGRTAGKPWRDTEADPLPVDDRTMFEVLNALQVLTFGEGRVKEARRLSYRSLDIEQIGHVYEGLLDHGCVRARETALGLKGKKGAEPEVSLAAMEAERAKGETSFLAWLEEETGRTANQVQKDLSSLLEPLRREHLLSACEHNQALFERVLPFAGLLRDDLRDLPVIFLGPATYDDGKLPGSLYVTQTSERRDSGTQYTTKELADEIVRYALEPIVYAPGPAEGAEPADWRLKSSAELLKLKVCDPAVGSGAILVAACRYLAERLVEAWDAEEKAGLKPAGLPPGLSLDEDRELLARRVITDHCLFGVDRNPMAAEMAKLSLWLTTMAKERPFTFLDHAIHAGDSLLGITSLEQLEAFHLDPKKGRALHQQGHAGGEIWGIAKRIAEQREVALDYGRRLSSITVLEMRDAEEKRRLQEGLRWDLRDLEAVADLLIGATLSTAGKGERALEGELKRLMFEYLRPAYDREVTAGEFDERIASIRDSAVYLLDAGRPPKAPERRPLHWPLAFPEVFLDPDRPAGFDAMVGNPPFLGGKRISGAMGSGFREHLVEHLADGRKGHADLVAYFYLRCSQVTTGIGMLATNSIAQGDSREVGLDWLAGQGGWVIHRAVKSRPWPGEASLEVAELWLRRGQWKGPVVLDGLPAQAISPSLDRPGRTTGNPVVLQSNRSQCFNGSFVLGMGFVLEAGEASQLIADDERSADVIFPFLNGEDLNDHPRHLAARKVINFFDWSESEAARFPACWKIVEQRVRPERQRRTHDGSYALRGTLPSKYWQYAEKRPALYETTRNMRKVLVIAATSKLVMPVFVPTGQVFSHATYVFAYDDDFHFGVLSSAFHWWWAVTHASTLETRIRYTPTDCFETFAQPDYSAAVEVAGKALDDHRRPLMIANNEGLTKTYNRVHNRADQSPGIVRLRELHRELDVAVRDAYGWGDLELDHGFHETSQGVRYTIGPAARTEVLDRLLELNHQRYAEEVAAGLHDKRKGGVKGAGRKADAPRATLPLWAADELDEAR